MSYSLDLRQRVIAFLQQGGQVTQAAKLFQVGRATIYRWLGRDNLAPTVVSRRPHRLDWDALEADVRAYPNDRLIDRSQRFGVGISTIAYALKRLNITRKKNNSGIENDVDKNGLTT